MSTEYNTATAVGSICVDDPYLPLVKNGNTVTAGRIPLNGRPSLVSMRAFAVGTGQGAACGKTPRGPERPERSINHQILLRNHVRLSLRRY